MNLLEYLEDERPVELKGSLIRIREPPLFVFIPPRKPIVVKVLEKSSETRRVKQRP